MKIDLVAAKDKERYLVRYPYEIQRILQGIMESKASVALYGEDGSDFVLSSIVALEPDQGYLVLEQGSSQQFNTRLQTSGRVICATTCDHVHIQFTGHDLQAETRGNEPVFRVRFPTELLRLQRREYYRLITSMVNPVRCMINTGGNFLETTVVDISIGGVGMLAYEGSGILVPGRNYHGCRIAMPGTGEFAISLVVRNTFDITLKNGRLTHRAGCQFIDLPPSVETEIQRFINRMERERRARYV